MTMISLAAAGGSDTSDDQTPFNPWVDDPLLAGSCLAHASDADRDALIALFSSDFADVPTRPAYSYDQLLAA